MSGAVHRFDSSEPDDLYGDLDSFVFSFQSGAEELRMQQREAAAKTWLAKYTGYTNPDPQEPEGLDDLPEEEAPLC